MKLSVIIPVYNAERYLCRCLDSLFAQDVQDYEVLAVDDGSTDASPRILAEYRQRYGERLRILTVENGGQGRARNLGIRAAKGEYLGFVDSDDWTEPEMFGAMLAAAEAESADLVLCGAWECREDGTRQQLPLWEEAQDLRATAVWNKLVKRSLAEGLFFPEGIWYEDLPFSIKLVLSADRIARVPRPLYHYRVGQPSTMNNKNIIRNLELLTVLEQLREWLCPRGFQREYEQLILDHLLVDAINRVNCQHGAEKKQVLRALRAYARGAIPRLGRCEGYRRESRNRRIIIRLNFMGLQDVSMLLLRVKRAI